MAASKRLVIIEDDPDLLEIAERQFRHAGYEVFTARDGVSGMEMILQYQPQAIVLDLLLPRLRGLEMLEKVRQYSWGKQVKVIVLTNFEEPEYLRSAQALGVADFLLKANYRLEDVVKRVDQILEMTTS